MPNDYFRFKQFVICQDKCAMKVGTDGILLGAWTSLSKKDMVLDVGTGTGLLALMVAQRAGCSIDAIEINKQSYLQAKYNVSQSKWNKKVRVYNTSLQAYAKPKKSYDLIICNPPFYTSYMKPSSKARIQARNAESLSLVDLMANSFELMNESGRLAFIIPYGLKGTAIDIALSKRLFPTRLTQVSSRPEKSPIRVLIEVSKLKPQEVKQTSIVINDTINSTYSEDYRELTKDFYLKF